MAKKMRVKIQSLDDPTKFKYVTTYDTAIGDTLSFKWHKRWTVIKIINGE